MQYRQQTDRPASEGIQGLGCEGMDWQRHDLYFCWWVKRQAYLSWRGQCGCNHQYYAGSIQSQRHDHHWECSEGTACCWCGAVPESDGGQHQGCRNRYDQDYWRRSFQSSWSWDYPGSDRSGYIYVCSCCNKGWCDDQACYSEASGIYLSEVDRDGGRDWRTGWCRTCCSDQETQPDNGEDNALSGIPDRYAVSDCGMSFSCWRHKPCYREDFREQI